MLHERKEKERFAKKRDLLKRVSDRVEKAKSGNFNCNEVYTENESLTDG